MAVLGSFIQAPLFVPNLLFSCYLSLLSLPLTPTPVPPTILFCNYVTPLWSENSVHPLARFGHHVMLLGHGEGSPPPPPLPH